MGSIITKAKNLYKIVEENYITKVGGRLTKTAEEINIYTTEEGISMYSNTSIDMKAEGETVLGEYQEPPEKERDNENIEGSWLDTEDKDLEDAILGQKVKIKLKLDFDVGTKLKLSIKARKGTSYVDYTEDKKLIEIPVIVPNDKEFITKEIHLNPHFFYKKDEDVQFLFYVIEQPAYESKPLKFKDFGKPNLFKKDKTKSYLYEKLKDGTSIAYVSGNRLDILTYQKWFENDSNELDATKRTHIKSYFEAVYGTRPYWWSPKGEFGNEANRKATINYFDDVGEAIGVPPSVLYTYAVGEGLIVASKDIGHNFNVPINSFLALGLDFFGHNQTLRDLYNGGYLNNSKFFSGGISKTGMWSNTFPSTSKFSKTGAFMDIRNTDGSVCVRDEGGGPTNVYPVWFKDMEYAIKGSIAVYARAYDLAVSDAQSLGWTSLSANENTFYGYFKVQYPNRSINHKEYGYTESNFLKHSSSYAVPKKAYERWVTWRYILLTKYFKS